MDSIQTKRSRQHDEKKDPPPLDAKNNPDADPVIPSKQHAKTSSD